MPSLAQSAGTVANAGDEELATVKSTEAINDDKTAIAAFLMCWNPSMKLSEQVKV